MEERKYDLIAFTDKGLCFDVRVDPDEDTVWLTKDQMAMLFDRDRSVISRHIKSIYKEGKLSEKSTCASFARVPSTRKRSYESIMYNLDVIISVGYHVGASFNHMGKRAFAVMKMEDEATIRQLKERIDNI